MNNVAFTSSFVEPAGSPIRELFPYLSKPGLISFAGGYPSPGLLDGEGLQQAAQRAFAGGAKILQYGATEGVPQLREALGRLCATRGIACDAGDMLVTTGSQQAFDLLVRVLVGPGDAVYVETPTYPAAIQALRLAGASIEQVPIDGEGLELDWLEAMLRRAPAHRRPKLLYTVPTFSNPSGALLSQARRERLVALALEYRFIVVEDDPYGELRFTGPAVETVYGCGARLAGAANPVVYLSSLSKTVAPALRIGWMVAPQDVLRRCAIAKQTTDLCTSPLAQLIALEYLGSGRYAGAVEAACAEYKARMHAMTTGLREQLGTQFNLQAPGGGMFVWAEFNCAIDPKALFDAAVACGVLFVPGAAFYASEPDTATMRLSYAAPNVEEIREGVGRLARAVSQVNR